MIEDFLKLDFKEKKEKMLVIIENLKSTDAVFARVYDIIQNNPNVKEDFLVGIYKDLMYFADASKKHKSEEKMSTLNNIQKKIEEINQKETAEREKEQLEIDDLIKNIK
jgi:hypothetical protein